MKKIKFNKQLLILLLVLVGFILCSYRVSNGLPKQTNQQEKSSQQVLKEQLIDDTHDAFLVDTKGKLGTLLVTAELGEKDKGESESIWGKITFSVWNPKKMEQPMQTFSEKSTEGVASDFHKVVDANFDGFQDFGYLSTRGIQPYYWHYWLWDEEQGQFTYCKSLTGISEPQFDAEKQVVSGWERGGASSGTKTIYRWIDGYLNLLRQIDIGYPKDDGTHLVTVNDLIGGEMVEIYRTQLNSKEGWLDTKWFDLDYHGEPESQRIK